MMYKEETRDLFSINEESECRPFCYVQCISADFAMGKGIAAEFNRRFNTKTALICEKGKNVLDKWDDMKPDERGMCLKTYNTFNLVIKRNYWDKPTYKTMQNALYSLKEKLKEYPDIKMLAMPLIGCGLDRLKWEKVSEIIQDTFFDTDIEIIVCKQ